MSSSAGLRGIRRLDGERLTVHGHGWLSAHPTGVMPDFDIEKPLPELTVQVTPLDSDTQVMEPSPVV